MFNLINGDCLEELSKIKKKSVDLILTDLPYGVTDCKWDVIIPFDKLWPLYNDILKDNGVCVLFGSEPFSTLMRSSNIKMYKYDWIWQKSSVTDFLNAKKQPLRCYENICVFYKKQPTYNPQMRTGFKPYTACYTKDKHNIYGVIKQHGKVVRNNGERYPINVLQFDKNSDIKLHPSQKPVKLLEYIIKTYTNEGDLVVDSCMGSGSTGEACLNTNRQFIGIEKDKYFF